MIDTLDEGDDEDTEDIDIGSLEDVSDERPDISEGMGDWAQEPADPKLESNDTSDPELWDNVREARLLEIAGDDVWSNPEREWQCFNMMTHG